MALALPASVTLDDMNGLLPQLSAAVAAGGGPLQVDASAVTALDTSAIALLLQAQRLAKGRGRGFELLQPPAQLVSLARLYGVESLLALPSGRDGPAL